MRWEQGRRSDNIEDRRGLGGPAVVGGGIGVVGLLLAVALMGGDPTIVLQQLGGGSEAPGPMPAGLKRPGLTSTDQERLADFVSVVLADTEDTRVRAFQRHSQRYSTPRLVLFEGAVASACGTAQSAMGPFYCPNDQKVYIDLDFYRQLGAPGHFAQAYVIAHEVGHHVQQQLGSQQQVQRA